MYLFANGDEYCGTFVRGSRQGRGKYNWGDGSYYEGEWREDRMNGFGVFVNSSVTLRGFFENDNFVQEE